MLGAGLREENYWSKIGLVDADPRARGSVPVSEEDRDVVPNRGGVSFKKFDQGDYVIGGLENWGASGLAGAWAEENTRESIFNAFRRKETFATSGPRILVRFFGGFDLDELTFSDENIIKSAYETGVPMGGDIFAEKQIKLQAFLSGLKETLMALHCKEYKSSKDQSAELIPVLQKKSTILPVPMLSLIHI